MRARHLRATTTYAAAHFEDIDLAAYVMLLQSTSASAPAYSIGQMLLTWKWGYWLSWTEIQDRIRMPVSLDTLLARDSALPVVGKRSPSGCVEAIARCVAAFQRATEAYVMAAPPLPSTSWLCDEIASKICSYANAIASKMLLGLRDDVMELTHHYIQNRIYDLAVKSVLRARLEHHRFWSFVSDGRQSNACFAII